jgi:uncharacterized protein
MAANRRWAVVTGASSGIGAEIARVLAGRGYALVLVARREERLAALAGELAGPEPVEVLALDLAEPGAPARLFAALDGRGIALHTLVNNAGFGLRGAFADLPLDRQEAMVDVNVRALTSLSRLALPGLIGRRAGGILNLASLAAFQAGPHLAVYYATKAYVLSLSEALHEEAKPHGVVVTALCPGPVRTEFIDKAGMGDLKLFRSAAMDAATVARAGVDGYEAGRAIVIPGARNRLGALGAKLLPRAVSRRVAGMIQRAR